MNELINSAFTNVAWYIVVTFAVLWSFLIWKILKQFWDDRNLY